MVSAWEPPQGEFTEIEVEASPVRRTRSPRPVVPDVQSQLESARRGARGLRILAYFIATSGVLGFILVSFWDGDEGDSFPSEGLRQRIGNLLMFMWAPFAIAALVYTAALLVTLYAARIEFDARRLGVDRADERLSGRGSVAEARHRSSEERRR